MENLLKEIESRLCKVPCIFSWQLSEIPGQELQCHIEKIQAFIEDCGEGFEVESYNIMGFYLTRLGKFLEARRSFEKSLAAARTEDEKIATYGNLAWLGLSELHVNTASFELLQECIVNKWKAEGILGVRGEDEIPELLATKAFITLEKESGESAEEGYKCITRALQLRPNSLLFKITEANIYQLLCTVHGEYKPERKLGRKTSGRFSAEKVLEKWKDVVNACRTDNPEYFAIHHARALVKCARAMRTATEDDEPAMPYINQAMDIAEKNNDIRCSVVDFLLYSTQKNKTKEVLVAAYNMAHGINNELTKCDKVGRACAQIYLSSEFQKDEKERYFQEGEESLKRALDLNDRNAYHQLCLLYTKKYHSMKDAKWVAEQEKVYQQQFFYWYEDLPSHKQHQLKTLYSTFLASRRNNLTKHYSSVEGSRKELDLMERKTLSEAESCGTPEIAVGLYRKLLANQQPPSTEVYRSYGKFLNRYGDRLALSYFSECLQNKEYVGRIKQYDLDRLRELAEKKQRDRDKIESDLAKRVLELMN
ncbi:predicted protein [Nematostella vectensis]|uniref:Uncharacterized protein n=1 Tax=Nematostella vectensis TaxID=45351 RepID=A7S610_NEMVE|nr:predicted protein [Nematostella vectensis]|eukprot:XP_001632917.1 predicted protein [Nematostella vectensis]